MKKTDDGLEELPEDVKKKLEKREAERSAKSNKKGKKGKVKRKKKKEQKKITVGKAFVSATYNNTKVTLTDVNGDVISWASAGMAGFKGAKKSTPYAAQIITRIAVGKAREVGLSEVSVFVKGVGTGRESAVRALNANGLTVTLIKDITPMPHNGCRKRNPRRV
ncbi:MAG: 30S ribosomal protein S11 [Candidatus Falkowbacteria bacterium]